MLKNKIINEIKSEDIDILVKQTLIEFYNDPDVLKSNYKIMESLKRADFFLKGIKKNFFRDLQYLIITNKKVGVFADKEHILYLKNLIGLELDKIANELDEIAHTKTVEYKSLLLDKKENKGKKLIKGRIK